MLDKDADGFLSIEELRAGSEIFGHTWSDQEPLLMNNIILYNKLKQMII